MIIDTGQLTLSETLQLLFHTFFIYVLYITVFIILENNDFKIYGTIIYIKLWTVEEIMKKIHFMPRSSVRC